MMNQYFSWLRRFQMKNILYETGTSPLLLRENVRNDHTVAWLETLSRIHVAILRKCLKKNHPWLATLNHFHRHKRTCFEQNSNFMK